MATWIISLTFEDGELKAVTGPNGAGTYMDPGERRQVKKSRYGLRPVETIFEHDSQYEPITTEAVRKCYMIIGGYKVEVPCS
jgi:hypothetical protein